VAIITARTHQVSGETEKKTANENVSLLRQAISRKGFRGRSAGCRAAKVRRVASKMDNAATGIQRRYSNCITEVGTLLAASLVI